jgi:hypothetical protein
MNARRLFRAIAPVVALGALFCSLGSVRARASSAKAVDEVSPIEVDGTRLKVRKADGSFASDEELLGAVLIARGGDGIRNAFRIDAIDVDPRDPSGEVVLYTFSTQDPTTGAWKNVCTPDAQGVARGFPLAGVWTASGEHRRAPGQLELTCTSGAFGKCVRMGYKPWKSEAMWDLHQACVRMVRADYCGDGTSHTRNGTPIDVYDGEGIQRDEPAPGMSFEAAWGKDGAVCVTRTRVPDVATLERIRAACPAKLGDWLGERCTEESAKADARTLIMNKS